MTQRPSAIERVTIDGALHWRFSDGRTLPIVAGADDTDAPVAELSPEQLGERIDGLEQKAQTILDGLGDKPDEKAINDVKAQIEQTQNELRVLTSERDERLRKAEIDAVKAQVKPLQDAIADLAERQRQPMNFTFNAGVPTQAEDETPYGKSQEVSFYRDLMAATHTGDRKAQERLEKAAEIGAKAMGVGTQSAGGFLVPPQRSRELLEMRERASALRSRFSRVQVSTEGTYQIPSVTGGLTAGWVAEFAEKPLADLTFAQLEVSIFTAAGLAVTSNQLLKDSNPSIDRLINRDLAKRLARVEELAFVDGSGTGQPRGILQTAGINTITLGTWGATAAEDAIIDAIAAIQDNLGGEEPTGVVMHPRRWVKFLKFRDADGRRLVGDDVNMQDGAPSRRLAGLPVYLSTAVPTNRGVGVNEDAIIVGKLDEALILDREAPQYAASEHVYFTSNRTVFRAEERVGFTAARYPKAFTAITGAGLVP